MVDTNRCSAPVSVPTTPSVAEPARSPGTGPLCRRFTVFGLGLAACLACAGLHAGALLYPVLLLDDFALLLNSWTWTATWDALWLPHNEHAMPLGRLSTWALVQLGGGRLTAMPALTALQGPLAELAGMGLIYLFVRRETNLPMLGLLALTVFGVTTQYNQAVTWFSASFVVLALDSILLALVAAQRWRQAGHRRSLAWCVLWVALAPGWFASGILAGPLCFLYLLLPGREDRRPEVTSETEESRAGGLPTRARRFLIALIPMIGTLVFLAALVTRPETAARIIHAGHYGHQTVFEVFRPLVAFSYTSRVLVDHLVVGTFGFWKVACPPAVIGLGLVLLACFAIWWWYRAPHRGLLLLGWAFILPNYLLIFSFRAPWSYEQMTEWNRYDLLPHLGLTLFLIGGLRLGHASGSVLASPGLSGRRTLGYCLLIGVLFISQLPRGVAFTFGYAPDQMPMLQKIEAMDARCRELRIGAGTAHEALGSLAIPWDDGTASGWKFLRGSDDPLPLSVDEVRRLLRP